MLKPRTQHTLPHRQAHLALILNLRNSACQTEIDLVYTSGLDKIGTELEKAVLVNFLCSVVISTPHSKYGSESISYILRGIGDRLRAMTVFL